MERNPTYQNRNLYSYQHSVNNQTELSNFIQSQANNLNNLRTNTTDNANLLEILQNATDDSKSQLDSDNVRYNDGYYESDFNIDRFSSSNYENYENQEYSSNESYSDIFDNKKYPGRAMTAPTKSKNEAEDFRFSAKYILLEKLIQSSNNLILRTDGRFEVESDEGSESCKIFLERLELLINVRFFITI